MKIVAEIGSSHGGDIKKAEQLIDLAKNSGADCVKFQIFYADEILHPKSGIVPLPSGKINLYENFKKLEVNDDFFIHVKNYALSKKIDFCASPFGFKSLNELLKLNPSFVKIASPELNYFQLLNEINNIRKKQRIPIVLSSGVSRLYDIEKALDCFNSLNDLILLHCITSYPAPTDEYNISVIENLSKIFDIKVGVSDHSTDPILVPLLTIAFGGIMIEKHITLSNDYDGLDDKVALNGKNFEKMCKNINKYRKIEKDKIIADLIQIYGKDKVLKCIGNGKKVLAKSEIDNYYRTNRSIHFMQNIKAGTVLQKNHIAILRTEKVLTPGISPEFFETIIGTKLAKDAIDGEGVTFDHLFFK
ncbi:MAG: spore coat protein [Treponema sp.]|nr:spore coat protein [Treponema sp.]